MKRTNAGRSEARQGQAPLVLEWYVNETGTLTSRWVPDASHPLSAPESLRLAG